MAGLDHNAFYQRTLLQQLPRGATRVLEIGCGAGGFATRLAERLGPTGHVDAWDVSPVMVEQAVAAVPPNVTVQLRDAMAGKLPAESYDAVVSLTVLHHLPLAAALERMAAALRPGGTLAAVALPRLDVPREIPLEAMGAVTNQALSLAARGATIVARREFLAMRNDDPQMPVVLDPEFTTREVRAIAEATLPGSRVRRLLWWRYLLTWTKPGG